MFFPRLFLFLVFFSLGVIASDKQAATLSVEEAHEMTSEGGMVLVDIRSKAEWLHTGVAPQALTLTMHQQGGIPRLTEQLLDQLNGNKDQPVALICAGGVRSSRVQQYLQKQGFTQVYNVEEGMEGGWFTQGWIDRGLPVQQYP